MQKIKHSTTSASRPARKTTGTLGYFKDEDAATKTKGTAVTADFLNDLQDELTTLITDPTGGNVALDSNNTHQVLDAVKHVADVKIAAALAPTTAVINNFVKTVNASPHISSWSDDRHINSGTSLDYPVQTVTLTSPPTGATTVLIRFLMRSDWCGNAFRRLLVRKNNTESWVVKGLIDPIHGSSAPEGQMNLTIPVVFDDTAGTFQYYCDFNNAAAFGSVQTFDDTINASISVDAYQEGFWVPVTVLTAVGA